MNRAALLRRFRHDTNDIAEPYLWSDEWFYDALDDAIAEACMRARLLYAAREPDVCYLDVVAGRETYLLHPSLYELADIRMDGRPISLVTTEWLDEMHPRWREDSPSDVRYAVQDDTRLRLVPAPWRDGQVVIEGYRLPLTFIADGQDTDEPEIHRGHHRHLLDWVKHMAYLNPDTDAMDLDRAALAENAFTARFGRRPSSDMRRSTRIEHNHHSKAYP